ncbi:MAG: hypothetical protein AB1801_01260 [Chloroflexota bacterium]
MLVSYFSPLAPAAVLLLGAFILSFILPGLPPTWRMQRRVQVWGAPLLVGLAGLAMLGTRLTFGPAAAGEGMQMLSGWNFSTAESAAMLAVQANGHSLAFLLLTLLLLLATTLAFPLTLTGAAIPPSDRRHNVKSRTFPAGWLALGAAASVLFVSANRLTTAYAVLIFDGLAAIYWLRRGQTDLGVARLFLGILTAAGLALVSTEAAAGNWLFGLALWLRLGLYPFIETGNLTRRQAADDALIIVALSLAAGLYLTKIGLDEPLPLLLRGLIGVTMLVSGLLAWLAERQDELLLRLVATLVLFSLLGEPPAGEILTALAVGLILSLAALWLTPRLGQPRLSQGAWSWPYLPAAGATLTLIGLPWLLTWPAQAAVYQSLFERGQAGLGGLAILSQALALSGLVHYWRLVWQGAGQNGRRAVASVVIMVPFLIPGLAPFILATLIKTELPSGNFEQPAGVFLAVAAVIAAAAGLAYYRARLLNWLNVSPAEAAAWLSLNRLRARWEEPLLRISKFVLRLEVLLEGQHYVGWALFTALVGILIIFLGR